MALWRAPCEDGIGVMAPIPYYQNLLFSVAHGESCIASDCAQAPHREGVGKTGTPAPVIEVYSHPKCHYCADLKKKILGMGLSYKAMPPDTGLAKQNPR